MGSIDHTGWTNGEVMVELGHWLQAGREDAGLSVTETAQRAGLSRRTLWRALAGGRAPRPGGVSTSPA